MSYQHREAYCLMKYRDTAGNEESIWNSRDGVTPFIMLSRQGLEAQHVDWQLDVCTPNHKPKPGDRVWIDMTREKAMEIAKRKVDHYWDAQSMPMRDFYLSKEAAIESQMQAIWHNGEAPDLIEWPGGLAAQKSASDL